MSSTSDAANQYVFVYGTLRRGQSNDITLLNPAPVWVGEASIEGTLYHLGRYPGIILGGPSRVVGEIWQISNALELKLDEIEMLYPVATDEYIKRQLPVKCNTRLINCIVYEINPAYAVDKPIIAHGDWVKRNES
jgi:gamma-glutamylcyclotransferase (GGCT)/AIG2-like uncharacterized protein YtfP